MRSYLQKIEFEIQPSGIYGYTYSFSFMSLNFLIKVNKYTNVETTNFEYNTGKVLNSLRNLIPTFIYTR